MLDKMHETLKIEFYHHHQFLNGVFFILFTKHQI